MKKIIVGLFCILFIFAGNIFAQNSITLVWDVVGNSDGYILYWHESGDSPDIVYNQSVDTNSKTLAVNLFKPGIEYTFYVSAYNEIGESDYSNTASRIVREGEPYTPPADNLPIVID